MRTIIYWITKIEFVGVVSLFGNGLLKANAAQLQKIVNSTRYSKGLKEEYFRKEQNFLLLENILPFN